MIAKRPRSRPVAILLTLAAALMLGAGCANDSGGGSGSGSYITYCTVTFYSSYGDYISSQSVQKGMKAHRPDDPTGYDGYTFDGWYYRSTLFDFSTPITEDITLVAYWTYTGDMDDGDTTYYIVRFDTADGTLAYQQRVASGATAERPDDPTLYGYTFGGWYYNDTLFDFSTPITSDITLTARWIFASNPDYTPPSEDDNDSDIDDDMVICTLYTTEMFSKDFANNYGYIYTIRLLGAWRSVELNVFGEELKAISNRRITLDLTQITGTTNIDNSAFCDCPSLVSVKIGGGVTKIGESAFDGCSSLESITIGNSVTSIGDRAFSSCSSLLSVKIGDGVTKIGDRAFSGCSLLESVTMGNSVTEIGKEAFDGCSSLGSLTIPVSVIKIGDRALYGTWLSSIEFKGTVAQWNNIFKGTDWNPYTKFIRCIDGWADSY